MMDTLKRTRSRESATYTLRMVKNLKGTAKTTHLREKEDSRQLMTLMLKESGRTMSLWKYKPTASPNNQTNEILIEIFFSNIVFFFNSYNIR